MTPPVEIFDVSSYGFLQTVARCGCLLMGFDEQSRIITVALNEPDAKKMFQVSEGDQRRLRHKNRKKPDKLQGARYAQMVKDGVSYNRIAKQFNVTPAAVAKAYQIYLRAKRWEADASMPARR